MKLRTKRIFHSAIVMLLVCVICLTYCDITSFAVFPNDGNLQAGDKGKTAENSSDQNNVPAAGADGDTATDGYMNYSGTYDPTLTSGDIPGYVIMLATIPNNITSPEYSEAMANYNATKDISERVSECQAGVIQSYLYRSPAFFYDNAKLLAERSVLMIYRKGAASYADTDFTPAYYRDGNMNAYKFKACDYIEKDQTVSCGSPEAWVPYDILTSYLMQPQNKHWLERFSNGELIYEEAMALVAQAGSDMNAAWNTVEDLFIDTGNMNTMMNGIWKQIIQSSGTDNEKYALYRLRLLDFFLAIDYKLGQGTLRWEINTYLDNLNNDGCDNFVFPITASVIGIRANKEKETYFSTLFDYYGLISNLNGDSFKDIILSTVSASTPIDMVQSGTPNRNNLNHKNDRGKANNMYFEAMEQKFLQHNPKPANRYYVNRRTMWWSGVEYNQVKGSSSGYFSAARQLATTLYPTDIFGVASGNIGYTYLALGGGPAYSDDGGGFRIKASSAVNVVAKGSTVAANVTVDLKQADPKGIQDAFTANGATCYISSNK